MRIAPNKEASIAYPNLNFHKNILFPSYTKVLSFNTWCLQTPGGNGPLESAGTIKLSIVGVMYIQYWILILLTCSIFQFFTQP